MFFVVGPIISSLIIYALVSWMMQVNKNKYTGAIATSENCSDKYNTLDILFD